MKEYHLSTTNKWSTSKFDALILKVAHKIFLDVNFDNHLKKNGIIYDVKGVLEFKVQGEL